MHAATLILPRPLRLGIVIGLAWALIAFAFALQGYGVGWYRGSPQPWWPSLGYALAIFSVWAILTPAVAASVRRTDRLALAWRLPALAAGLPVASALHVALFALVFWPVYNDEGRIPTRQAMAERMALRNLDTNALLYLLLVGGTLWRETRDRRARAPFPAEPTGPEPEPIAVRSRGRLRLVAPADIDWIAAAGDYVELHARGEVHLVEGSLVSFERSLLPGEFARIHRAAMVRVDRVAEVRGVGRGDALVRLADGTELRLSRRYRSNLAALLRPGQMGDPARRSDRSRSPNDGGEAT